MSQSQSLIRSVSDTARWVAVFRARESERPDALFRDPFARRLAGDHGEQIAGHIEFGNRSQWSFVMRTYLFDQFVLGQIQEGLDLVINLGAGLDARPYRMPLPASLRWIEVDLPQILEYKENVLAREKPACALERVSLDLSKASARREFFTQASSKGSKALIITEGVLAYHAVEEVAELARDLAGPQNFRRWALDIASPGLLRMIQQKMPELSQAGTPLKFGPKEGPEFFVPYGWNPIKVASILKSAARAKRLSWGMRMLALLPESHGTQGSRPWSGVCLFAKR
jgi:methyltransferase (TIGR00027 family)